VIVSIGSQHPSPSRKPTTNPPSCMLTYRSSLTETAYDAPVSPSRRSLSLNHSSIQGRHYKRLATWTWSRRSSMTHGLSCSRQRSKYCLPQAIQSSSSVPCDRWIFLHCVMANACRSMIGPSFDGLLLCVSSVSRRPRPSRICRRLMLTQACTLSTIWAAILISAWLRCSTWSKRNSD